jgi:non-specific serine/threonine protein kinase
MTLACCLGFQGNATAALHAGLTALDIALEIQHQQWTAASHWALGSIYLDILAWDAAHRHLEQGLRVARSIGGTHWIGHMLGYLTSTLLARGEIEQAEGLLAELLPTDTPMLSMSQRSAWRGRIVLALARGRLVEALAIAERMLAAVPAGMGPAGILVATQLHGETLAALHRFDEAATVLQAARALAETQGAIPRLWRIDIALGRVLEALGQRDAAEAARVRARATIEALAAAVPEATLRAPFLSQALALLPPPKPLAAPPTPRAEVANPGGLTARERQVARCVAAGKSNRAIAEELVVSERTIESHVANILGKLAFTSRIQIAVWATEKRP